MSRLLGRHITALLLAILMAAGVAMPSRGVSLVAEDTLDPGMIKIRENTLSKSSEIYKYSVPLGIKYTKQHPLVVVANWTHHPYSYMSVEGRPDGLSIDILKHIFLRFCIPYKIRMLDNVEAWRQLRSGEAHLMIGVDNLPEPSGLLCGRTVIAPHRIVCMRLKTTPMLRSVTLLGEGDTLMLNETDYCYHFFMRRYKGNPPFTIQPEDSHVALTKLLEGQRKYFLWDEGSLNDLVRRYGVGDKVAMDYIDIPSGDFRFISADSTLLYELDRNFTEMQERGELTEMYDHWLQGANHTHKYSDAGEMFFVLVLTLIVTIFVVTIIIVKSRESSNMLKKEFLTMSRMGKELSKCQLLAIDIRRNWVYNLSSDLLPKEGLSGNDYEALIHPDDISVEYNIRKAIDEGETSPPTVHFRIRRHDGEGGWRNVAVNASIKVNSSYEPVYLFLAINDYTDDIKQEAQLRSALTEYSNITEVSDSGIAYYDKNGVLIDCDNKYLAFFGKNEKDKAGAFVKRSRLRELCVILNGMFLEKDMDTWFCAPVDIPELSLVGAADIRIRTIKDDAEVSRGYIVSLLDLTEQMAVRRKKQRTDREFLEKNRALQKFQTELKFILNRNNMQVIRWIAGNDYIEYSNDMLLFTRRISFEKYVQLLMIDDKETLDKALRNPSKYFARDIHLVRKYSKRSVLDYDKNYDVDHDVDSDYWFDIYLTPRYDSEGTLVGFFGVRIDITDQMNLRKSVEEEAALAAGLEQQKAQFLANMTHELRTPLNVISGFAEVFSMADESEERDQYISIMTYNCRILTNMVENILNLSTIETEGLRLRPMPVDFAARFLDKAEDMREYFINPEVKYRIDKPFGSLMLKVDADRIMQVLEAFVTNAVKFTQKGFIHIGYRCEDGLLTVYCRDTGCGIPQEKQREIFDSFVKFDEYVQGVGLGLALCRRISDGMGADIDIYSREGTGTVISFTLPVKVVSSPPQHEYVNA